MKKAIFNIFNILIFLFFSFCAAIFFISRTIIIEREIEGPTDLSIPQEVKEPVFLKFFEEKKENFISQKKDFLEVNLEEMKIRLYKKGLLIKEVPILKKGDPQEWGGSAAGLYKVLSGHTLSYSAVAEVYMPYALNYYGKYYIHGNPFYSWGERFQSDVSGGCLNLSDEDAKSIFELTELNMPVLVIDKTKDNYDYFRKERYKLREISAESYLVVDLDSGYVFAEKDFQKQLPLASLTKLLTALVVAENVDLKKSIFVEQWMLGGYGSTKGLEKGKSYRVVELFYPLLIESSNDAAEVLSYYLGRKRTINLMNDKAGAILMEQTRLVDPSGYEPENLSTAKNLFYLARYLLNNRPPILEITKGKEVPSFGEIKFKIEDLWNKNVFINDPTFVGGKTGYIISSKNTALFIFRLTTKENVERNIAVILLGSENSETDTQKIYIWLLKNYFKLTENI